MSVLISGDETIELLEVWVLVPSVTEGGFWTFDRSVCVDSGGFAGGVLLVLISDEL